MMLRIGNERAFTLIEVLAAVVILSVGLTGVIRAYGALMNGIDAARFSVDTSYLLKEKMSDIEREAIENCGIPPGTGSGTFDGKHAAFGWETEAAEVMIGKDKEKEGNEKGEKAAEKEKEAERPKETLSKVRVSVIGTAFTPHRRSDMYTYVVNVRGRSE